MVGPLYLPELQPEDLKGSYLCGFEDAKRRMEDVNPRHPLLIYVARLSEAASITKNAYALPAAPDSLDHDLNCSLSDELIRLLACRQTALNFIAELNPVFYLLQNQSPEQRAGKLATQVSRKRQDRKAKIQTIDYYTDDQKTSAIEVLARVGCYAFSPEPFFTNRQLAQ